MTRMVEAVRAMKWASARLAFYAYLFFSLVTVVGGFLTAPIMSWYFFGTWKFWKHLDIGVQMFTHGWKMVGLIVKENESGFMLDVALASSPHRSPVAALVTLNPRWEHGPSCGTCSQCCEKIDCPILDAKTGLCRGYDSFFWRYFNCGRFPSAQREIEYYECPKWQMKGETPSRGRGRRRPAPEAVAEPALRLD